MITNSYPAQVIDNIIHNRLKEINNDVVITKELFDSKKTLSLPSSESPSLKFNKFLKKNPILNHFISTASNKLNKHLPSSEDKINNLQRVGVIY